MLNCLSNRSCRKAGYAQHGRHWSERIWTVIATCVQQGKSVYEFLCTAIGRWFADEPAPSLLPGGVN